MMIPPPPPPPPPAAHQGRQPAADAEPHAALMSASILLHEDEPNNDADAAGAFDFLLGGPGEAPPAVGLAPSGKQLAAERDRLAAAGLGDQSQNNGLLPNGRVPRCVRVWEAGATAERVRARAAEAA